MSDPLSGITERLVHDADGAPLHAYDDVILLDDVGLHGAGNHPQPLPAIVRKGTRATLLILVDPDSGLWDLECYPTEDTFVFAQQPGSRLRLVERGMTTDDRPPSFSDEDIKAIQEGLDELERRGGIPHDQVFARLKARLGDVEPQEERS